MLRLVYFNARGLAETSRILLALAQVDYEDYRYPIEVIDPVNHIYKREEFEEAKKTGRLDKSMGKLPLLELEDGSVIAQSKAIERYISKRYNFMGSGLNEEARIDAVCECIRDIKDRYQKVRSLSDPEKEKYFSNDLPGELESLVKTLDTDTKFAIGNKLSLADVSIYSLITQFYDNKEVLNIAGNIPRIRDIVMKVASRPEVRVWMQDRPKTLF